MRAARIFLVSVNLLALMAMAACVGCEETKKVSLEEIEPVVTSEEPVQKLRVAVAAVISPKATFVYYTDLLDYVSKKMDMPVELVQRETYAEVNELLKTRQIDMAFVCTGAYVDGHDDFGMELLVAPMAFGQTVYYSYIIVPAESGIQNVEQLRGKKFAFTDPMSNTGKLAPTYMLALMNETPDTFFGEYTFTYSHDKSIESVDMNIVDGAAVDSLVWEFMNITNPSRTTGTRIISKSEPFGIPPVVVHPGLNPAIKEKLKDVLLHMDKDEWGRETLSLVMIEKFTTIDDSAYDSVRMMKERVGEDG